MMNRSFHRLVLYASAVVIATCVHCHVASSQDAAGDGFRSIFDGASLAGWDGDKSHWSVEDGAITGQSTAENPLKANTFLIWRGGEVADFDLRLKLKITGGNSGIQFRSQEAENEKYRVGGYQADFDAKNEWSGILYDELGRGIVAQRGQIVTVGENSKPKVTGKLDSEKRVLDSIKQDAWNDYRILAVGNHLQLFINGIQTVDVTDDDPNNRDMSGLLALQLHAGPPMKVSFKDIRIKDLGKTAADPGTSSRHDKKQVVFVAGVPSHGWGAHEHYAGCVLLARRLAAALPEFETVVVRDGWPSNAESAFEGADTIVMYADGGGNHPVLPHLEMMDRLMNKGVGLVCLHYAVEIPKGPGGDAFLDWMGGYFEAHWSVNPHWTADFKQLPSHPITNGVAPFSLNDEWYFHLRFRENLQGVTPILTAVAPASTMTRPDGSHSGNPHARKAVAEKQPQHVAWCAERPDGGRGFGLTGGHYHASWAHDDLRKLVLNAIVWTAQGEVPEQGVTTESVSDEQLEENQDYPKPKKAG